jgi:sugar fermentation stimulation protein A
MNSRKAHLRWPPLVQGVLLKRYKRFLADVLLEDGSPVTAHCANSGRMTGCALPGQPVYLSRQDNPRRKLKYTWELIRMPGSMVGVNTLVPNRLVRAAIANGDVKELAGFDHIRSEVAVPGGSRLDLLLEKEVGSSCFVEVKNCTLVQGGVAKFPDAVTQRGRKHLEALQRSKKNGFRSVIFFLVQRMDATGFSPADQIDSTYGAALREAAENGVELLAYDVTISLKTISLRKQLPIFL